MKRYLAILLSLVMILALCLAFSGSAYAAETENIVETTDVDTGTIVSGVFSKIIAQYVMPLLKTVLMTIASAALAYVAKIAGRVAYALLNTKFKRDIAKTAMNYVEQKYKDLHGEAKMNKALEKASELLSRYGIVIDVEEMKALIEAALCEFNAEYKKEKVVAIE